MRPYGEADLLVVVLTEALGRHHGWARGGAGRRQAAIWQPGNLVAARWVGRLADQLGSLSGELVHAGAALAFEDALKLRSLGAACAVAAGALPERVPHARVFGGLLRLIAGLGANPIPLATLVRWEADLLADLGYGLDLSSCALTGATDGLAYVSPKSGRAVAAAAAGPWRERLLALPAFLLGAGDGDVAAWRDGLLLTGHFLARDAFGAHHRPLPAPRASLYDHVCRLAARDSGPVAAVTEV